MMVVSLGGSRVVPDSIDIDFLKELKNVLLELSSEFIIVCGGGKTARKYQAALKELEVIDSFKLDEIGILATKINAKMVSDFLGFEVYSGTVPGHSTDYVTVELAVKNNVSKVINFSNISYVYDKDPKFNDAKKLEKLNFTEYLELFDSSWTPGMNVPFDVKAAKLAMENNVDVCFTSDLENFKRIVSDLDFKGTLITNK